MTTVLVTGSTGTIGSALVPLLRARGLAVRAFSRNPDRARRSLGPDVEVAPGDFADASSVRAAMAGVDAVFLACGNVPEQVAYERAVIDAAATSSVPRLVKLSARGAAVGAPVAYWHWHGLVEEHLRASAVPAVLLQPGFLMTNLLAAADQVRGQGVLIAPAADARIAMIDPLDVAAVAAAALTEDGHEGRTYVLTGPEAITYDQVAAGLTEAAGRPIAFVDVPEDAARAGLNSAGLPPFVVEQLVAVFAALRRGEQATVTDTVEAITARRPGSLVGFAARYAEAFAAASPVNA